MYSRLPFIKKAKADKVSMMESLSTTNSPYDVSEGSQSEFNGISVYNEHPFITRAKADKVSMMESLCITNSP